MVKLPVLTLICRLPRGFLGNVTSQLENVWKNNVLMLLVHFEEE